MIPLVLSHSRDMSMTFADGVSVSDDGMWVVVGTGKRTVRLFAINPYGGKPNRRSHLEGRVRNVTELVSFYLMNLLYVVLLIEGLHEK